MYDTKTLYNIIQTQSNSASYSGLDFTRMHRLCVYEAFEQLLEEQPQILLDYLLHSQRGSNLQSRLFQNYISILESKLPFSFEKNGYRQHVYSLLDDNLSIFDGLSVFAGTVNEKGIITNNTTELYVSGRCHKPFFIGKILDIVDVESHLSILSQLKSYSFSEIQMNNIAPNTSVLVSHIRIIPHYQMGAMAHLNRIRKEITDSLQRM